MGKIKNYIILGLAIALGVMIYLNTRPEVIPDPITITIPGSSGTSGVVQIDTVEVIKEIKVYLPGKKEIVVDNSYKDAYEAAIEDNDELAAKNLFLESIRVKEYNEVAIDNDTIKVDLYAKTRGSLLAYRIDYNIKDKEFTYTPEVMHIRPKMTVLLGLEAILPPIGPGTPALKLDLGFQGQGGDVWSGGIDTQGNKYVGFKKSFTIFK
jgi:hypothetical protein